MKWHTVGPQIMWFNCNDEKKICFIIVNLLMVAVFKNLLMMWSKDVLYMLQPCLPVMSWSAWRQILWKFNLWYLEHNSMLAYLIYVMNHCEMNDHIPNTFLKVETGCIWFIYSVIFYLSNLLNIAHHLS